MEYCKTEVQYYTANGPLNVSVSISDARRIPTSLDQEGFEIIQHKSVVTDWHDQEQQQIHYHEIEKLVREVTRCDWTIYYPAIIRDPATAAENADLTPVSTAHSDYSEKYWDMLNDAEHPYQAILAPSKARAGVTNRDIKSASRLIVLQFWRNIGPLEMDYPLCIGDARSFERTDFYPVTVEEYGGVKAGFESLIVLAPKEVSRHRWYTYPKMNSDEALMFRAWDSELVDAGKAFWTPHMAFRDPVVMNPQPRASIEMRAICGFR